MLAELKRRNVFRVAVLYALVAWLLLQVADVLFDTLELPAWTGKLVLRLLVLGFPLAMVFAWVYELTPEGLKKQHEVDRSQSITAETGRRINYLIGALAALAIAVVAVDRLLPETAAPTPATEQAAAKTAETITPSVVSGAPAKSIAVLPFVDMSAKKD